MSLADYLLPILFYACITGAVASYLLYRRLMSGVRTVVRVKMSGNLEKTFDAVEVGRDLKWLQDGEEMNADIPLTHESSPIIDSQNLDGKGSSNIPIIQEVFAPEYVERWGVYYRVWSIIDGADTVLPLPWASPEIMNKYFTGDDAAKERYRRRVRALNSFRQLAAGLGSLNRWQAAALVLLGLFAGLFLSPIIQGALT